MAESTIDRIVNRRTLDKSTFLGSNGGLNARIHKRRSIPPLAAGHSPRRRWQAPSGTESRSHANSAVPQIFHPGSPGELPGGRGCLSCRRGGAAARQLQPRYSSHPFQHVLQVSWPRRKGAQSRLAARHEGGGVRQTGIGRDGDRSRLQCEERRLPAAFVARSRRQDAAARLRQVDLGRADRADQALDRRRGRIPPALVVRSAATSPGSAD